MLTNSLLAALNFRNFSMLVQVSKEKPDFCLTGHPSVCPPLARYPEESRISSLLSFEGASSKGSEPGCFVTYRHLGLKVRGGKPTKMILGKWRKSQICPCHWSPCNVSFPAAFEVAPMLRRMNQVLHNCVLPAQVTSSSSFLRQYLLPLCKCHFSLWNNNRSRKWRICEKPFPRAHYKWITIYVLSEFSYPSPIHSLLLGALSPVNLLGTILATIS